jgi:hypothetical protein
MTDMLWSSPWVEVCAVAAAAGRMGSRWRAASRSGPLVSAHSSTTRNNATKRYPRSVVRDSGNRPVQVVETAFARCDNEQHGHAPLGCHVCQYARQRLPIETGPRVTASHPCASDEIMRTFQGLAHSSPGLAESSVRGVTG